MARLPSTAVDGSRTAGVLLLIDGLLRIGREHELRVVVGHAFVFVADYFWPGLEVVLGIALVVFRQRVVPFAVGFVLFTIIPLEMTTWRFWKADASPLHPTFFPMLVTSVLGAARPVPQTLLLVGMPERGRYRAALLIFVLSQWATYVVWRNALSARGLLGL